MSQKYTPKFTIRRDICFPGFLTSAAPLIRIVSNKCCTILRRCPNVNELKARRCACLSCLDSFWVSFYLQRTRNRDIQVRSTYSGVTCFCVVRSATVLCSPWIPSAREVRSICSEPASPSQCFSTPMIKSSHSFARNACFLRILERVPESLCNDHSAGM